MRYYLVAGEASGDLHASGLIGALKSTDPDACFRGWGGDLMAGKGAEIVMHYRDLAFMGLVEVVKHLPAILRNFRRCEKDILAFRPDVVILVDYPGFNLPLARRLKKRGIRVFYYISPQLWAWRSSRVHGIKKTVDRMFVILPFEKGFYERYDYHVDFVGHPLLDVIGNPESVTGRNEFLSRNGLTDQPIIALLPGSRLMEIGKMLKIMVSVREQFTSCQFVVAGAPSVSGEAYREALEGTEVRFVTGQTYDLLRHATVAMVTSGTATLETALFGVPQVVCYRGNPVSYQLARRLVHVKHISLVNLICDRTVVPELIQGDLNSERLAETLRELLEEGPARQSVLAGYNELREKLGGPGASVRTARLMMQYLKENQVKESKSSHESTDDLS